MNRLKELREDKDLLQKDIANFLNIDQSNYSRYELEKINIPIDILYRTDIRTPYAKSIIKEENSIYEEEKVKQLN